MHPFFDHLLCQFQNKYILGLNEKVKSIMMELELAIEKCNIQLARTSDFSTLVCREVLMDLVLNFNGAINDFDNAIMMKSNVSNVYFLRAYSFYNLDRLHEVLADLKKGICMENEGYLVGSKSLTPKLLNFLFLKRRSILLGLIQDFKRKSISTPSYEEIKFHHN